MFRARGLTRAALFALLVFASPAWALDLTGVWAGKQDCDAFDGDKLPLRYPDDIMVISQKGADVSMAALFDGTGFNLVYQGQVIADTEDPQRKGEAALTECTTAPGSPYQETLRAIKLQIKKAGDADFDATSVFLQLEIDDSPTFTGTCRWKYRRIDTADPGVPDCSSLPTAPAVKSWRRSPQW